MRNQVLKSVKEILGSKGCKRQRDVYDILSEQHKLSRKSVSTLIMRLVRENQLTIVVEDKVKYIELFDVNQVEVEVEVVVDTEPTDAIATGEFDHPNPNLKQTNVDDKEKMEENIGKECTFTQRGGITGSGVISGLTINKTKTLYYYLVKATDGKKKCCKSQNVII